MAQETRRVMADVQFSPQAQRDLREIVETLTEVVGLPTARKYHDAIRDAANNLRDFPASGSPRPGLGATARVIVIDPWLMFYEFDSGKGAVSIVRILHGRRDITGDLIQRR
jgi:toxin ParE1/3/4